MEYLEISNGNGSKVKIKMFSGEQSHGSGNKTALFILGRGRFDEFKLDKDLFIDGIKNGTIEFFETAGGSKRFVTSSGIEIDAE
jgi:hypothetical protein